MAEDDFVEEVKAKLKKLKLERENRKAECQDLIRGEVGKRVRLFCCSCGKDTGVKKGGY